MRKLRWYQQAAVDAVAEDFGDGLLRVAVNAAPGAGKSTIAAELTREHLENYGGTNVLFLVHRREILFQVYEQMKERNPNATISLLDDKNRDTSASIVLGNIATVHRMKNLPDFSMIVVDETHRAVASSYRKVLDKHKGRLVGLTGTFLRDDSKNLGDVFEKVSYSITAEQLIDENFLVEPVFKTCLVDGLDLRSVRTQMGDLSVSDVDLVLKQSDAYKTVVKFWEKEASDRSTVVFTPTVLSARAVATEFMKMGYVAACIDGETPSKERDAIVEGMRDGSIQVLVNCLTATEGLDVPRISCVVLARPTKSRVVFRQAVGRGMRLHPGKKDCLVIDLAGVTTRHDLVTASDLYDDLDLKPGETIKDARERKKKELAVAEEVAAQLDVDADWITGSFNLYQVTPKALFAEVRASLEKKAAKVERERVAALPDFPEAKRHGPFLRVEEDLFIPLYTYGSPPQYRGSYLAAVALPEGGYLVYVKDTSKASDQYSLVTEDVFETYDWMEHSVVEYTKSFPGTAGVDYFQHQLMPDSESRRKKAGEPQKDFLKQMMSQHGVRDILNPWVRGEIKQPRTGTASDWINTLSLGKDVAKFSDRVRKWWLEK